MLVMLRKAAQKFSKANHVSISLSYYLFKSLKQSLNVGYAMKATLKVSTAMHVTNSLFSYLNFE
jgi:hypothetical protein